MQRPPLVRHRRQVLQHHQVAVAELQSVSWQARSMQFIDVIKQAWGAVNEVN